MGWIHRGIKGWATEGPGAAGLVTRTSGLVRDISRASLKGGAPGGRAEIHHAAEVGRSMGSVYVSGILARDWLTQVLDSLALYPSGPPLGAAPG